MGLGGIPVGQTPDGGLQGAGAPQNGHDMTSIIDQRIIRRAIRNGWLGQDRWDLESTAEELLNIQAQRPLTAREKALLSVHADSVGSDPKGRRGAVSNILIMDRLNQEDEHRDKGKTIRHEHLHAVADTRRGELDALAAKLEASQGQGGVQPTVVDVGAGNTAEDCAGTDGMGPGIQHGNGKR